MAVTAGRGRLASVLRVRFPPNLLLVVPALVPMAVLLVMVVVLIWVSFQRGLIGTPAAVYSLANYDLLLTDPIAHRATLNTLVFTLSTVLFALAWGLPIAWLAERTNIPGKTLIYVIMTIGLLIPGIFLAMGFTFTTHPRIGFVNMWLQDMFGFITGPIDIATPLGMGFVQGLSNSALAFILTVQMFRAMNPALEEAASVHGLGFWRRMRSITLPLAMPGILAAIIYIGIIALATFDIPAVIGLGSRVYMLSTFMYVKMNPGSGVAEYGVVAALGAIMILVAVLLTFWYSQVIRKGQQYQVITGKGYRPTLIKLGKLALVAWGFILVYALISKVIPLLTLTFVAFSPYISPPSLEAFERVSLVNFDRMNWSLVLRGAQNTTILVLLVPLVTLLVAFCTSWIVVRARSRAKYLLEFGAFLPHALPEVILAIAAFLVALFVLSGIIPIYGTVWLIAIVYVVSRLTFATRVFNGALLQVHKELEEAAYAAGMSVAQTAWRILVPLLRPALMTVWIWTALLVYRELTVAVFLMGPANVTVPAAVWSHWFGGALGEASAAMLMMIVVMVPLICLFWWFGRRSVIGEQR